MFQPGTNAGLVRILADRLIATPIDQVVTYGQLGVTIGQKEPAFFLVQKALRIASADAGALFVNVRTVGYKRLAGENAHTVGKTQREKMRKGARRATVAMSNAIMKTNDISPDGLRKAYAEMAQIGLIQHMTYDRNMPEIKEGSPPPPTAHTVQATMEALRAHQKAAG